MFAPEAILPVQVLHPPADCWLRRLYVALLGDALRCLDEGTLGGRVDHGAMGRHACEAWDWIMSDAEDCLSFLTVCSVLDLSADAIRGEVRRRFALGSIPRVELLRGRRSSRCRTSWRRRKSRPEVALSQR